MDSLASALRTKTEALQRQLLANLEANLSGEVLQTRSGALKDSILANIDATDSAITATISSVGVAYAAIQEYGGGTPPHEIVPVKGKALALAGGGFARRVRHPGSTIAGRAPLGGALEALRGEIETGLKSAVRAALGIS